MSSSDVLDAVTVAARDLLADRCGPGRLRGAGDPSFDADLWRELAAAGWFDVLTPEVAGGLGLGAAGVGALFREAGAGLLPGPLLGAAVARPLLENAGVTVPDGPVAVAALPSRGIGPAAVLTVQGARISGTIPAVEHADVATSLVLVGEQDGAPVLLLVPTAAARIHRQTGLDPLGRPCLVHLDHVEPTGVVADPEVFERFRTLAWTATAHRCLGVVETAVRLAVDFASIREQFGRPIATFQALAHILADLATTAAMTGSVCAAAAVRDDSRTAQIALVFATRAARTAVEGSLQVHGGIGFTTDLDLHWYYRHGLALEVAWGLPALHEQAIGRGVVATAGS
jgi:alkylation response protein AidB-like acyl-CoA dehydrogenase